LIVARAKKILALLAIFMAALIDLTGTHAAAGALGRAVERAAIERIERTVGRRIVGESLGAEERAAAVAERNIVRADRPTAKCFAIANKCLGLGREANASRLLSERFPHARVQSETYLLTPTGRRAIDPVTKMARRVDFSLLSDGRVAKRFEVTSQFASKSEQLAREERIFSFRADGSRRTRGLYARDRTTGRLVPVNPGPSQVMRLH